MLIMCIDTYEFYIVCIISSCYFTFLHVLLMNGEMGASIMTVKSVPSMFNLENILKVCILVDSATIVWLACFRFVFYHFVSLIYSYENSVYYKTMYFIFILSLYEMYIYRKYSFLILILCNRYIFHPTYLRYCGKTTYIRKEHIVLLKTWKYPHSEATTAQHFVGQFSAVLLSSWFYGKKMASLFA